MDHRKKHHAGGFGDFEAGDGRTPASPANAHRRARLSPVALLSLGVVLLLVGIATFFHFSQVSKIKREPEKAKVLAYHQVQTDLQWEDATGQNAHEDAGKGGFVNMDLRTQAGDGGDDGSGLDGLDGLDSGADGAAAVAAAGTTGAAGGEINDGRGGVDDVDPGAVVSGSNKGDGGREGREYEFQETVDEGPDYRDDGEDQMYVDSDIDPDLGDYSERDAAVLGQQQGQAQGQQQGQAQQQGGQQQGTLEAAGGRDTEQSQRRQQAVEGTAAGAAAGGSATGATATVDSAAGGSSSGGGVVSGDGGGCGPLSRELLDRWAVNNTVLVGFTNSIMFRNYGETWLHHLRKAGITYWVLAVADNATAQLVRERGADHCFLVHENEIDDTNAAFKWGSRSWQLHTWQKVLTVRHVHQLGYNVINSDMDVVWLRNPLEHFLVKYTAPDYWVSMDPITTANAIGDDGPEQGVGVHHYMNTGVYFLRQTPGGKALIDKWYELRTQMQGQGFHDQDGLYQFLSKNPQELDPALRVAKVLDGKVALAQLPATLFQNGYSHCVNQIHKIHSLQPFEVHFVWVWGGNIGKMNRMREQRYFVDPPAYYSEPDFLSFDLTPIQDPAGYNDWTDTEAMVQFHISALQSQLTDIWHGLALAALLGRTWILPKIKCYCIQNWFENPQCRLPGEPLTRFPIAPACPADFAFNMEALASFNLSGRHIPFREYSFLDNERTPAEVKDNPLIVTAVPGATAAALNGRTLTIPAGLKSDQLLATLQPYLPPPAAATTTAKPSRLMLQAVATGPQPVKRVHFTNPRLAFGGWSDPRVATEYQAHAASLPIRWCCRPDKVAQQHNTTVYYQLQMLPEQAPGGESAAAAAAAAAAGTAVAKAA